jgi:hypothetical protein
MGLLHIANTRFEWELVQKKAAPLEQTIESHPISLQLQFLPLLYAEPGDGVAVTALPDKEFHAALPLHLLNGPGRYDRVESWGSSLSVQAWARKHNLPYEMPPWEAVQKVNSKEFSFTESPKLKYGALLYSEKEIEAWASSFAGNKVLKSCFGTAGRGHLFLPASSEKLTSFIKREQFPLIGEPWVERVIDFSTQWIIHKDGTIAFLGETECISDARGQYRENRVGNILTPYRSFIDAHKEVALPILQTMQAIGYFGNVGIDAMIYENDKLHPVVEINARKTMGYVALKLQQNRFPKQTIALSYGTDSQNMNLLPNNIVRANGSQLVFTKKLILTLIKNDRSR